MFRRFEKIIDPFASARLDQPPTGLLAFYAHYVGQARRPIAIALVATGLLAVINAMTFVFVGVVVDRIGAAETPATFFADNALLIATIAVLLLVVDPLLAFVEIGILNQALVPNFTNLIRWQTHRYVLRQSVGYFQSDFAGRIANKVMQTALAVRRSVRELIEAIWQALIFVGTTLVVLADSDLRLTVPLLVWLAGYLTLLVLFVPRIKESSARTSESYSSLMGRVVDSYSNILTVKLFGHAAREDTFARDGIERQQHETWPLMRAISQLDLLIGVWNMLMVLGLGWLAISLWSVGEVTVGTVATSLTLALRINQMSFWIMFITTSIAENIGIVRDGIDTIAVPREVVDAPRALALAVPRGAISFERVSFHYGRAKDEGGAVIDDLSLAIAPGERVGLVGRSGAGKSTLVQLLLRLHDVESGRILIDGTDIATVRQESLRERIGLVTQDTSLLHRSVLDNIRYGRPEATLAEVAAAAERAQAHSFIEGLVDGRGRRGYEAHVGERGVKLSGGQRQRIAIARVLLKDAPILVLDEATSALDSEVEAAIQEQLFNLMAGKTVIAIAHRLSTIAAMDRLVIMENGRIVEEGNHQSLLASGGLYARLWSQQSSGFVAA
ncbi:ABC transporter ATP-binding protein [Acuticoccus mangrovi]|uniref:ABC transporter ATP-binding protein n=1 Tax=Acuticoccus mangrovi TaxID=2796142 RepID=A0A934MHY8_9HYPH|nr:ABC transporter ATP-binding protein [Acuticoccus mangrovi]